MRQRSEKSSRCGFTLTEVLAVVAVLAIVAALAIPALVNSWRSAKLTKWDETAREIFLSAQNETSEMKAAGLLEKISQMKSSSETNSTNIQMLSASETASGFFPQTKTLLSTVGGSYVLEMNLLTGDIVDVYYSEANELTGDDVAVLLGKLDAAVSITSIKNDQIRYTAGIGYYGGTGDSAKNDGIVNAIQPKCMVINKEDLYIKLMIPGLGANAVMDSSLISASVKVQGERHTINGVTTQASQTFTASGSEKFSNANKNVIASTDASGNYTLYLLLDSMTAGKSFAELCPKLVPGDDLTLSLTLWCNGKTLIDNRVFARVNSLFATKSTDGANAVTATYRYVRQLHNLAAYCNVGDMRRENSSDTTFTLRQMQNVDFSDLADNTQIADGFIMPGNTAVDEYTSAAITGIPAEIILDGGGYVLKNFSISGTNSYAGLVGSCGSPLILEDLRVADPSVSGTENAGVLAGYLSGTTTVSNCRVYLTPQNTDVKMKNWMTNHTVKAKNFAGGFFGSVASADLTIENSFAALPVFAENNVGGILGALDGGTAMVGDSYTSGRVTAANANAGGVAGAITKGMIFIKDHYFTASDVTAKTSAGALIGVVSGASANLTSCTAYGTITTNGAASYGPMIGAGTAVLTACTGLFQSGNTAMPNRYEVGVTAQEYSELLKQNGGDTYPYLTSGTFPFAFLTYVQNGKTVTMPYYGDWPEKIMPAAADIPYGLCYYEEYRDGSWGFYGYDKQGGLINTLDYANAKTITDTYGYGVAAPTGTKNVTGPVSGWNTHYTLDEKITIASLKVDLYPWTTAIKDFKVWSGDALRNILDAFANRTVYLNPCFAASISLKSVSLSDLKNNPVLQVRTMGHLDNITAASSYSEQYYLKQTHNITVKSDTGMIDGNGHQFTYDGDNNEIVGLTHPLFNVLGGTTPVENIILRDVHIGERNCTAGPLAVVAGSTVTNCRVLSGSVRIESGNNGAAGLIGRTYSSAVIRNCFSANCTIIAKNGTASGLIGDAQGQIIKCYANNGVWVTSPSTVGCAAGFIAKSEAYIYSSFSCGTVSAGRNGTAVGFCNTHNVGTGRVFHCYSVTQILDGGYQYGFKNPTGPVAEACYWAKQGNYNSSVSMGAGYGTAVTFRRLKRLSSVASNWIWDAALTTPGTYYDDWTLKTTAAQTHPNSSSLVGRAYPYPLMIAGMEFYGDWPDSTLQGRIGAYSYNTDSGIRGISIDLSDEGEDETYNQSGTLDGYGILISDDVEQDASNWEIAVNYTDSSEYFFYSEDYMLSHFIQMTYTAYDTNEIHYYHFSQYPWWAFDKVTVKSFVFTYVPTGETYTFTNSNGIFAYTD